MSDGDMAYWTVVAWLWLLAILAWSPPIPRVPVVSDIWDGFKSGFRLIGRATESLLRALTRLVNCDLRHFRRH